MRVYKTAIEAESEIRRDLKSFGTLITTNTMQNMNIKENPDYHTHELTNYGYVILEPSYDDIISLPNINIEYCDAELCDRINGMRGRPTNPGNSWLINKELWEPMLVNGKMDYTYSERMVGLADHIVKILRKDKNNRRCWWPIFSPKDIIAMKEKELVRVPCSLGYNFQIRDNKLMITYIMRSCDFITHWANDVFFACALQGIIANRLDIKVGSFTHFMFSLHVYQKDVKEVF